jgi:Putative prokaryotic signal transducing protein
MGLFRRAQRPVKASAPRAVRVATAMHQPEAEMLAMMLEQAGIPVVVRRGTFDVPDMMAGGPRDLLVPADRELEARALLDPLPPQDQAQ